MTVENKAIVEFVFACGYILTTILSVWGIFKIIPKINKPPKTTTPIVIHILAKISWIGLLVILGVLSAATTYSTIELILEQMNS